MKNKPIIEFGFLIDLKNYQNYEDLRGCYPPKPHNTLLDLHNSSEDTQPHSIIAKYCKQKIKV